MGLTPAYRVYLLVDVSKLATPQSVPDEQTRETEKAIGETVFFGSGSACTQTKNNTHCQVSKSKYEQNLLFLDT